MVTDVVLTAVTSPSIKLTPEFAALSRIPIVQPKFAVVVYVNAFEPVPMATEVVLDLVMIAASPVTPVAPVAPVGPTGPAGPVGPVTPIGPVGPVVPIGPVGPVTPIGPVGPVVPIGPVAPVIPVEPVGPTNPVAPVIPVDPVGPTGPVGPVVPIGPVGPVLPTGPVGPVGPTGPVAPVTPVAPVNERFDLCFRFPAPSNTTILVSLVPLGIAVTAKVPVILAFPVICNLLSPSSVMVPIKTLPVDSANTTRPSSNTSILGIPDMSLTEKIEPVKLSVIENNCPLVPEKDKVPSSNTVSVIACVPSSVTNCMFCVSKPFLTTNFLLFAIVHYPS